MSRSRGSSTRTRGSPTSDFVLSRQLNLETIHDHDVVAERFGTIGQLRAELAGSAPGPQTTLAAWLDPV